MEQDLKSFVNGIKEKTGLQIAVFNYDGVCIAGSAGASETIDTSNRDIVIDRENGRTIFPVSYRGKSYFGRIAGIGVAEENYAKLIKELSENYFFKETEMSLTDFYCAVIYGEMSYPQLRKYVNEYSIPDAPCCVMLITAVNGKADDVLAVLENYGASTKDVVIKINDKQCGYIKFDNDNGGEYHSATEFAYFLAQAVLEEAYIRVTVSIGGTVKNVGELNFSYSQAMTTLRMSKTMPFKGDIHSFREYVLIKILEDTPKYKLGEYLDFLVDENAKSIFSDPDMINTAEEFLENNLNISETSRKLYLHRNTLMYRLDKIEKETGLNIRSFSDAVTFRLITILGKLLK